MKKALIEMFSEGSKISVMRVCTLSIVMVALSVLVYEAVFCSDIDWVGVCSLIGTGLTGKVAQKGFESK